MWDKKVCWICYYHVVVVWVRNSREHSTQSNIGGVAVSLNLYMVIKTPPTNNSALLSKPPPLAVQIVTYYQLGNVTVPQEHNFIP